MPRYRVAVTNEKDHVERTQIQARDIRHCIDMVAQAWEISDKEIPVGYRIVQLEIKEVL